MRLRPWPSAWRRVEEVQEAAEACQGEEEEGQESSSFDSLFGLELGQKSFIRKFSSKHKNH